MKLTSFEAIVRALNEANVRYLIAGGLAVNAHGYLRYTKDVDLVIELSEDNALRAIKALKALEFSPTIPVPAEQFANAAIRAQWVNEKNMKVMQLFSDQHRDTPIDIFVSEPFDFDEEYDQAYIDWTLTTWEGSRREELRRWRWLTLREKLQAVEEMGDLASHFREQRLKRGQPVIEQDAPD